jgi:hypothetical protein
MLEHVFVTIWKLTHCPRSQIWHLFNRIAKIKIGLLDRKFVNVTQKFAKECITAIKTNISGG